MTYILTIIKYFKGNETVLNISLFMELKFLSILKMSILT